MKFLEPNMNEEFRLVIENLKRRICGFPEIPKNVVKSAKEIGRLAARIKCEQK